MAFLDNSGDIILDAALTDIGRKRMAAGNFSITKFGLGDDEINYQLYNKNHPSGSAYYDLEILQTPVLQAATATNANINHGLLDMANLNILYMPAIKGNPGSTQPTDWTTPPSSLSLELSGGTYQVAANTVTYAAMTSAVVNSPSGRQETKYRSDGTISAIDSNQFIMFESGIDNTSTGTSNNSRIQYLVATNMLDSSYTVSTNSLFISSVVGFAGSTVLQNANADAGDEVLTFRPNWTESGAGTISAMLANYKDFQILGVEDGITGTSKYTVLRGARGTAGGVMFRVAAGLGPAAGITAPAPYYDYGKVNQNLFGDGHTYDYIDTTVYIRGDTSQMVIQVPVRILRQAT
jgi:hypothetical protein